MSAGRLMHSGDGEYGTHPPIADVNDHGTPFAVIADIIDAQL